MVELSPGEATYATIGLSFGAKGHQFAEPGEYLIRIYYPCFPIGFIATAVRRIRIAHPLTRAGEDLAHLMLSRAAAQFLYYGGSRRNPDLTEKLVAATERYAGSDPVAVRHVAAALGRDAARVSKRIETREGKRLIVSSAPDYEVAVTRLAAATAPLPESYDGRSAFDALTESRLVSQLADGYLELGRTKDAIAALDAAVKRLQAQGAAHAINDLQRRSKALRRRKGNRESNHQASNAQTAPRTSPNHEHP
jgi:hypothetical protein